MRTEEQSLTAVTDAQERTFHSFEQLERALIPNRAAERDRPSDLAERIVEAVADAVRRKLQLPTGP